MENHGDAASRKLMKEMLRYSLRMIYFHDKISSKSLAELKEHLKNYLIMCAVVQCSCDDIVETIAEELLYLRERTETPELENVKGSA